MRVAEYHVVELFLVYLVSKIQSVLLLESMKGV
jgi:hypothetical protein